MRKCGLHPISTNAKNVCKSPHASIIHILTNSALQFTWSLTDISSKSQKLGSEVHRALKSHWLTGVHAQIQTPNFRYLNKSMCT